jgi:hypothetical protein
MTTTALTADESAVKSVFDVFSALTYKPAQIVSDAFRVLYCLSWAPSIAMGEIAKDRYKGYELNSAKYILSRFPKNYMEKDDALGEVRSFALEAATLYNPSVGTMFSTFVYRHLNLKAKQFVTRKAKKAHREAAVISSKNRMRDTNSAFDFSLDRIEPLNDDGYCSNTCRHEYEEFLDGLSSTAVSTLNNIMHMDDFDLACRTFRYQRFKKVADGAKVPYKSVRAFVDEVKKKAPKFMGCVDG